MKASVKIEGVDEVKQVLRLMPTLVRNRTLRNANRASGRIVAKKQKELAPKGKTRNLETSIGTESEGKSDIAVGPRRRGRYKGHAGHLVNFGTKPRRKKRGASTGVMPANPFVEESFDQSIDKMKTESRVKLARAVSNQMKRIIKR